MRGSLCIFFLFAVQCCVSAQLRFDADIRIGRSTVKQIWIFNGRALPFKYDGAFSYGADAKIGYEFKHGVGLYSGVSYDKIRYYAAIRKYHNVPGEGAIEYTKGKYPHSSDFVTIPLRLEYRFCHNIIRPYVGYGVSFQVHHASNITDDMECKGDYEFQRNIVIPTLMFGIDFEYKKFILGFGRRKDQKYFWKEEYCIYEWTASQNTVRLGYRIF